MRTRHLLILLSLLCCPLGMRAQGFFNLTADEVRIDSVLPHFTYTKELGYAYADSIYEVAIEYPEFLPMTNGDRLRYQAITTDSLPALPVVKSYVAVERKRGMLDVSFVPLAMHNGVPSKLVSFKLAIHTRARATLAEPQQTGSSTTRTAQSPATADKSPASRYAEHSVLSSGKWAKIRVPATGVYHLSDALLRKAGFSNPKKVKIYGYGGMLVEEKLTDRYLRRKDDLKEVPTSTIDGRRLFYAHGPLSWWGKNMRIRNPYSQYGYYFLTENDEEALVVNDQTFNASIYPHRDYNNTIYEVDDFAWYSGGRNLYDSRLLQTNVATDYAISSTEDAPTGKLKVNMTANSAATIEVSLNDKRVGTVYIAAPTSAYDHAVESSIEVDVDNIAANNKVTLTKRSGSEVRLDYISLYNDEMLPAPDLHTATIPEPDYVGSVENQDRHADGPADMIIIVPTSQKLRPEAERLKALHEQYDSMTVRIVTANELYNEFSSGTPDASSYRRYMKMLYDRATDESEIPSYLVLFGDCAWDNRMLVADWRGYSPDDFLLCYESENSFSATKSYVSDEFFCLLDDEEMIFDNALLSTGYQGKGDVAVGRFPVRSPEQARIMVDKVEAHLKNLNAGAWQNTIVFMGDDGNNNIHMQDADAVADVAERLCPAYDVKRVMWDSYQRTATATGFGYPDVTNIIRKYMKSGALMMNYSGHGAPYTISHEQVIGLDDFENISSACLPLWFTASCDIMPFDSQEPTIGETAVLNPTGGAVAFYGTTRTVYSHENRIMNLAFSERVLDPAKNMSIGEAIRQAKNHIITEELDLTVNKLQYALLGDPALRLALPRLNAVVDNINGKPANAAEKHTMKAGEVVTVSGHIEENGIEAADFTGTMTAMVSDPKREVVCRLNDTSKEGAEEAFVYDDYSGVVYKGTDSVRAGRFTFSFIVPKDITYSNDVGSIKIHAVNASKTKTAAGNSNNIVLNGSAVFKTDSIGPSIYCYLNSTAFTNGDVVNGTPFFMAEINDEDGINATGNGIGHDLQLTIDGDPMQTYSLNDNFTFDFGSYRSGRVGFSIPRLTAGEHKLMFRAWDVLNNSNTSELTFVVDESAAPRMFDIECMKNPAVTSTSFRITHDRVGANVDVRIEIFDMAGRHLGTHTASGIPSDNTLTVNWDLTINGGQRLGTGVYLYRAGMSSDGSDHATKTKKLIVLSNK